jgi:ABC-type phosphate transport system permease subunit
MKVKEQVMRWVFAATAAFSIAAVALICVFLFLNGLPFFTKYDLGAFLSGTTWKPANNIFGILPMIVGSLYVTGGALLFGTPVGILAGIYLARFCPVRLRKIIEPMIGLMAGVPSIVYGFFGLTTLVPLIREMFGGRGRGQCILTASLLLGIMILPTIIQLTSAAVKAVPNSYYEGSLALGATDERSVFRDCPGGEIRHSGVGCAGDWPRHRRGNGGQNGHRQSAAPDFRFAQRHPHAYLRHRHRDGLRRRAAPRSADCRRHRAVRLYSAD